jgi:hypothetical protein
VVAAGTGLVEDGAADESGAAEDEQVHASTMPVVVPGPEDVIAEGATGGGSWWCGWI